MRCLRGIVGIEEDASVWFDMVIRGDIERIAIGAGANVQDGCVLHTDSGFPLRSGRTSPSATWWCCTAARSAAAR